VVFAPSERTRGLYQDLASFGITPGSSLMVTEIREGVYLYFQNDVGGWPWSEFRSLASTNALDQR
jgi:hypothetical protein